MVDISSWDEAIDCTAKWWADRLWSKRLPTRDNGAPAPVVTETTIPMFESMAQSMNIDARPLIASYLSQGASVNTLVDEQIGLFEKKLRRVIHLRVLIHYDWNQLFNQQLVVKVDYEPDQLLTLAGIYAGIINDERDFIKFKGWFDWKTGTIIMPDKVLAKVGAGAEFETVWSR